MDKLVTLPETPTNGKQAMSAVSSADNESQSVKKKKRKVPVPPFSDTHQDTQQDRLLKSIQESNQVLFDVMKRREDDECDVFGKTVALELRKLTDYQRDMAKRKIQDALIDIKWNTPALPQRENILPQ